MAQQLNQSLTGQPETTDQQPAVSRRDSNIVEDSPLTSTYKEPSYDLWFLRLLTKIYILGIFYVLFVGFRRSTPLPEESIAFYGISKVSSQYGPGAWGAWLLSTVSCCLDRLFRKPVTVSETKISEIKYRYGNYHTVDIIERDVPRPSRWFDIDLNLVAVLAYPVTAAFDLLLRLRGDFNSVESAVTIGSAAAALNVVDMGLAVGATLAGICSIGWFECRLHGAPAIVSWISVCFLVVARLVFETRLGFISAQRILSDLFCLVTFCPEIKVDPLGTILHTLFEDSKLVLVLSLFDFIDLRVDTECVCVGHQLLFSSLIFTIPFSIFITFLWLSDSPKWPRSTPFRFLGILVLVQIGVTGCFFLFCLSYAVFITIQMNLILFWVEMPVPQSTVLLTDLDQISVFIIGGVLVLLSMLGTFFDLTDLMTLRECVRRILPILRQLCGRTNAPSDMLPLLDRNPGSVAI